MTIQYNILNAENLNTLITKAKAKENGVFSLRGIHYKVVDHKVTHMALNGEVLEFFGHFTVCVGKYKTEKEMKNLLK